MKATATLEITTPELTDDQTWTAHVNISTHVYIRWHQGKLSRTLTYTWTLATPKHFNTEAHNHLCDTLNEVTEPHTTDLGDYTNQLAESFAKELDKWAALHCDPELKWHTVTDLSMT